MPHPRTSFEQIALLLQGGGALGAYQAGVYEALAEADLHPDWVAGISIGAINSAIIAGDQPRPVLHKQLPDRHRARRRPRQTCLLFCLQVLAKLQQFRLMRHS